MTLAIGYQEPVLPMVSTLGPWSLDYRGRGATTPTSATYVSADMGLYYPIHIPTTCVAKRMWWANGDTVNASYNVEAGIYLDGGYKPGAKLITTGSVAQGTATNVQFADITDTTLSPGTVYWLYLSCSTTSATFFRVFLADSALQSLVGYQQGSIGPGSAPTTATPAALAQNSLYLFGFSTTTIT